MQYQPKYILHLGFDNIFKMKMNLKKSFNLDKFLPTAIGASYMIFKTLSDIGVPFDSVSLSKYNINTKGNDKFNFHNLKELQVSSQNNNSNKVNKYYTLFYGILAFFTARAWVTKDIINIDVKPNKVLNIIDEIAKVLDGKRILNFSTDSGHFALYEFVDHKNNLNTFQNNNDTPLVYTLQQTIKNFLYHIPQNVYIKYLYKIEPENLIQNQENIEENERENKNHYILYPQKKDIQKQENNKDIILIKEKISKKDEKIVDYVRTHNKKYFQLNQSSVINIFKGIIGYDFIKKKIGLNRFLPSPKLSPLKSEFYDFKLNVNNVFLFNTYKPPVSSMEIISKNENSNQIDVRFFITSQFKNKLEKFISSLPKEIKITKVISSLSRDDRFEKLEEKQNQKGLKSIKKPVQKSNELENTIQIFPFSKNYPDRPPEDKIIYNMVNKREKKHWW